MAAVLIAGALLLPLVVLAGVVWHVSNRAYREGLRPREGTTRGATTATVVRHSAGEVVLEPVSKRRLKTSGVWGLSWDGGYARISNPVGESNEGVRYSVDVMQGELAVGVQCELDFAAFPPGPAHAAEMSEVVYPTPFGDFTGWFAPGSGTTWLILVHGRNTMHREMLRTVEATRRHKLPTLSVSYRNDEGNPPTDDGLYHFGRDEWRDLEAAIEYALANGATDVVIAGESLGGVVALWFMHESSLRERVRGIVIESPLLDMASAVLWVGKNSSLIPKLVVRLGMEFTARRFHLKWADYDARPIFHELAVPVTLIHGERDGQSPVSVSEEVAGLHPDLVTLERVPGAGHTQTWNVDPVRYEAVFDALLERALGESGGVPATERVNAL